MTDDDPQALLKLTMVLITLMAIATVIALAIGAPR